MYTTPASGHFVITQFCADSVSPGMRIDVGGVRLSQLPALSCKSFVPGIVLPQSTDVTCTNSSTDTGVCLLNGILTKK